MNIKRVLIGFMVLIFVVVFVTVGFAGDSIQVATTKDWDKTKEYTVEIDKGGRLFWCGNKEIAVLRHESRDVSVITFYKNDLTDIKEETVNFAIYTSRHPICSDDSRYIFFSKLTRIDDPEDFFYYDRKTKRVEKNFSV